MVRLATILLGVDYLRTRWRGVIAIGLLSIALGSVIFLDALDGALYFPITPFAFLMLFEGFATLAVAWAGMGGQRTLRYVKGATFCLSALLVLIGGDHGNFALSIIFGTLFLVDGALQIVSGKVVRYRHGKIAVAGGVLEIAIAIFLLSAVSGLVRGNGRVLRGVRAVFRRLEHDPARVAGAANGEEPG